MSEISEFEIHKLTKEQNYIRGYQDCKADMLKIFENIKAEINELDTMTFIGSNGSGCASEMRSECLAIIDRHISGKENR